MLLLKLKKIVIAFFMMTMMNNNNNINNLNEKNNKKIYYLFWHDVFFQVDLALVDVVVGCCVVVSGVVDVVGCGVGWCWCRCCVIINQYFKLNLFS